MSEQPMIFCGKEMCQFQCLNGCNYHIVGESAESLTFQ